MAVGLKSSRPFIPFLLFISLYIVQSHASEKKEDVSEKLLVVTIATEETDGYKRFMRSAEKYGISVKVLGMGETWRGGDMRVSTGGGHKVNMLKKNLSQFKDRDDLILMFVDSYDVVFTSGPSTIIETFMSMSSKILFASESYCWPDAELASSYPMGETGTNQYLNSGEDRDVAPGFIGYASDMIEMINSDEIRDQEDDQLFYTKIYLNEDLRKKWDIDLDRKSKIFQCLNGAGNDMELLFSDTDAFLRNKEYTTNPIVIHGNGPSKILLNSFSNYLVKSWHPKTECSSCGENRISLQNVADKDLPTVLMSIFITKPTPFFMEFLDRIAKMDYPKNRMDLFLYIGTTYHSSLIDDFLKTNRNLYKSTKILQPTDVTFQDAARDHAMEYCREVKCDFFFSVDPEVMLTNSNTLKALIEQNRKAIAPMLVRPEKLWSNFWGALTSDGYYQRSFDYLDIVQGNKIGVWNVPYIHSVYLVRGSLIRSDDFKLKFESDDEFDEVDLMFPRYMRDNGHFMYVTNMEKFGHLVDSQNFQTQKVHPDLYEMFDNKLDWENRYIHENYSKVLKDIESINQPCPDVYWFPLVSDTFCRHLIEELEKFGKWSDGSNNDPRLSNGYENVPTRDIHMNQVGLEKQWLNFIRDYISPVQQEVYPGYINDPPNAMLNFVVRYKPEEQSSLRPHHDSSTYTMNIALNSHGVDYEGGGCRFVRYNCSVIETLKGWTFIHPGRLTHYHEGLRTTKGTRYIFVSFIDP